MSDSSAERFCRHFLWELHRLGLAPADMARFAWKPYRPEDLRILGPDRDRDLSALAFGPGEIERHLDRARHDAGNATATFAGADRLAFVLVPGFTHETLKNYSWHEMIEHRGSPHHILMLHPGANGEAVREQVWSRGTGRRMAYVRYPRSNADSCHITGPFFSMLHASPTVRRWVVDEGRKLVFVGYSNGAPISLETLAGCNRGDHRDEWILRNTAAFFGMCGDIGGSYLADDVLRPDAQLLQIHKAIDFCRRHPFVAKLAGMGTPQLLADMEGGVRALGHEVRQARIAEFAPHLPAHLHYFSVGAVLPPDDYRRRWWQFNLDDYAMWRQARVTDPVTVFHDGQVALPDNLVPDAPQVPASQRHHLGAVRTHHWGVSYRTFNFGVNRFPRDAFYRAVLRTVVETLEAKVPLAAAAVAA
jgi:hypothetical protein